MKTAIGMWGEHNDFFCASMEVVDNTEFPRDLEVVTDLLANQFHDYRPFRILLIEGRVLQDYNVKE